MIDAETASDDFFAEGERKALASERSVDAIRARFGAGAVTSGRILKAKGALSDE
jgi:DNA polymerase IV